MIRILRTKLHGASVTQCDLHYEGSISIASDIADAAGLLEHEAVSVWNVTNGQRFETYVISAPSGSGVIGINGAAARLAEVNDRIIIAAFTNLDPEEASIFKPVVLLMADDNTFRLLESAKIL